jgi:anti-anti-sigma regulatory factor
LEQAAKEAPDMVCTSLDEPGGSCVFPVDPHTGFERLTEARIELRSHLHEGNPVVVIDLIGVQSINTELISFLIACEMECQRSDAHLRVRNVSSDALKVFRFAGLNQLMDLRSSP